MKNENSVSLANVEGEISAVLDTVQGEVVKASEEETAADMAELAELEEEETHPEIIPYVEETEEVENAEIVEILEEDSAIDVDFMLEFLTANELDPVRRDKLFDYVNSLSPDDLRALWDAFRGSFGGDVKQIELNDILTKQLQNVDNSVSLHLRNEAVERELQRFGSLYAQLSRVFRSDMTDTPLGSFRVDNITSYIKNLHRQLTIVNSAVIEMAEIIMLEETSGDAADMTINIDRVKRICALVGYGAKNWGRIHETAKVQAANHKKVVEELSEKLRIANEAASTHAALYQAEVTKRANQAIRSNLFIGNHSGNFITTINDPENEYFRVSPFNLTFTQEKSEALEFSNIEDARKVLDAVRVWAKRNISVRNKFRRANINADTLFIFAETTVKVEG